MNPGIHEQHEKVGMIAVEDRRHPLWVRLPILTAVYLGLLVYGSLIPFDFMTIADAGGWGAVMGSPRWLGYGHEISRFGVPMWLSDVAMNVLLYVPAGFLLRLCLSKHFGWRWIAIAMTGLGLMLLSYGVECTQSLMGSRVASLNDVAANTGGGLLAGMLAVHINRLRTMLVFRVYVRWHRVRRMVYARLSRKTRVAFGYSVLVVWACGVIWLVQMYVTKYVNLTNHAWGDEMAMNSLPFNAHFQYSYDVAAAMIGGSSAIYMLIALLLWLVYKAKSIDIHARVTLWVVAMIAAGMELILNVTAGMRFDVTELIIAVGSVMILFCMMHYFNRSIEATCRRKQQRPVVVERRKQPHQYLKSS